MSMDLEHYLTDEEIYINDIDYIKKYIHINSSPIERINSINLYKNRIKDLKHSTLCNIKDCKYIGLSLYYGQTNIICSDIKELWKHVLLCKNEQCTYKSCISTRYLINHHRYCINLNCVVCSDT